MLTAKAGSLGLDFLVCQMVWQSICVLRPQYTISYLRNKDLSPSQYYWGTGNSTELWSDWPWCYWQREKGGPLSHVNKIQAAQGRLARSEWEGWSGEFHKHCWVNSKWESFRNSSTGKIKTLPYGRGLMLPKTQEPSKSCLQICKGEFSCDLPQS